MPRKKSGHLTIFSTSHNLITILFDTHDQLGNGSAANDFIRDLNVITEINPIKFKMAPNQAWLLNKDWIVTLLLLWAFFVLEQNFCNFVTFEFNFWFWISRAIVCSTFSGAILFVYLELWDRKKAREIQNLVKNCSEIYINQLFLSLLDFSEAGKLGTRWPFDDFFSLILIGITFD